MPPTIPELLIPAGSPSKLRTAVAYGADAVYVGAAGLSMRTDEAAFTPRQLQDAVDYVHLHEKKLYVAVNTMMFPENLASLEAWADETADIDFDACIVSDPGAFSLLRSKRPDLKLHISTQSATANEASADFWKQQGASRVILARECTLEHAFRIARHSGIEVEVFVHGAMCVAISGRCLLSAHLCGQSGSQGQCKHSCRWDWSLVEAKRPGETVTAYETDGQTVFLGSKDLCLVEHMPALVKSGVASLKVEGRMKSEYYVATVTRVYRDALDRYAGNPSGFAIDPRWMEELQSFSHRPYSTGFAFGYPHNSPDSLQAPGSYRSQCEILGIVTGVAGGSHTVSIKNPCRVGETVEWIAPGMINGSIRVASIVNELGQPREQSHCGSTSTMIFEAGDALPEHTILIRRLGSLDAQV